MLQQEVWWISAFSEDWISLTVPGQVCWFDRQSNRARDDRTGGHWNTKFASKPQIAWHCMRVGEGGGVGGEQRLQGMPMGTILPWLLQLAKQTISFLIMISWVIIYTKVAHSPVFKRRGRCFSSTGQTRNTFSCVSLESRRPELCQHFVTPPHHRCFSSRVMARWGLLGFAQEKGDILRDHQSCEGII